MQVFNLFIKIMRRNIPSAMIYIIVFFAVMVPMSKLISQNTSFEEKSIKVCIFDEDKSEASKKLIDFIGQKNELIEMEPDKQKLLDAMYYESIDYTFTIKKGYENHLSDLKDNSEYFETFKMHEAYGVAMMEQLLSEYVQTVRAYVAGGNEVQDAIKKAEESVSTDAEVTFENFNNDTNENEEFPEREAFFFRYIPYVFISVLVNLICPILLAFNRKDQRNRINCSCIKPSKLTAQLFMGCGILVVAIWLIFAVSNVTFNGMYQGVAWVALLNSFLFAVISALIALLIAMFSPSETVVSMITQCVGLGMCFLCGVFVPQNLLGDGVLNIAKFLPAYWFEKVNDTLAGINPYSTNEVLVGLGIQVGFAVLLALCIMLITFKKSNKGGVKQKRLVKPAA